MNENNYCVIMAGGIGSRFWPFSRSHKPKQFLDFFGTGRTLIQMTVDRFRKLVPIEHVLVVTNVLYRDLILEQIPDMKPEQVLCEPARRNTAPCIAYATARIAAMQRQKGAENANIVVVPSDALVLEPEAYQQAIADGMAFTAERDALLTLGIEPTRPETGYGYIQANKNEAAAEGIYPVVSFREKPDRKHAEEYLASGDFLWNAGIFIWNLRSISSAIAQYLPAIHAIFEEGKEKMGTKDEEAFIAEAFPKCESISVDYGIMEKAKNVYVRPSSFGWSDLGNWGSLYDLSEKDAEGNVSIHSESMFYDACGNLVTLESGKLAVVAGLKNMIVAEQDHVLLICPREEEQRIKQFVADAENNYNGQFN